LVSLLHTPTGYLKKDVASFVANRHIHIFTNNKTRKHPNTAMSSFNPFRHKLKMNRSTFVTLLNFTIDITRTTEPYQKILSEFPFKVFIICKALAYASSAEK